MSINPPGSQHALKIVGTEQTFRSMHLDQRYIQSSTTSKTKHRNQLVANIPCTNLQIRHPWSLPQPLSLPCVQVPSPLPQRPHPPHNPRLPSRSSRPPSSLQSRASRPTPQTRLEPGSHLVLALFHLGLPILSAQQGPMRQRPHPIPRLNCLCPHPAMGGPCYCSEKPPLILHLATAT